MSNKVMIGRYYPISSLIHRMNPLAKIICTLLFIITLFLANTLKFNILISILLILIILSTKIPLKLYGKMILSLKWLLLGILLIDLLVGATLETTIISILRIIYIVLYSSVLTLTTPPSELTFGLAKFFGPLKLFKVPVNRMALSITLALRFIPNILDTGNKILKSQASRGIDYNHSNMKGKLIAVQSLIIPMFVLTFRRADGLADSMETRLYNIDSKRVNFRQNKWGFYDTFLVLLHISLLALIIVRGVML